MEPKINIIVAVGADGAIGRKGELIWKLPGDLRRFKDITTGHPVIMGRKTWDSLPTRPLPGRLNIVVTRNKDFLAPGALVVSSVEEALEAVASQESFVIGGAEIYKAFMPYASRLYITQVDAVAPDADARLDVGFLNNWVETFRSDDKVNPEGISFRFLTFHKG